MYPVDVSPRRSSAPAPALHVHLERVASGWATTLVAILVLVLGLSTVASADHPVGPPIGNNRYKTQIERGPQGVDVDDYTAVLAVGDRLSFAVKSPFQSPLLPSVSLIDPEGRDRTAELRLKEKAAGKKVVAKAFVIDVTGEWAVRVAGRIGTEGTYVVSFKVAPAARQDARDQTLGGPDAVERVHEVAAVTGSRLDVDVSWGKRSPAVELLAVVEPGGDEVRDDEGRGAAELVRSNKAGLRLRKFPLSGGDGAYGIRLAAPEGATTYRVRWRVRPPRRVAGSRKLDSVEPHIIRPATDQILGVEGRRIRIDAWNLSTAAAPSVLFGGVRGRDVIVDPSGGFLDVTVPEGTPGSSVTVVIVNPDDQGSAADDLFYYVPPPVITAVVDATGAPLAGGAASGGVFVRIEGEFLRNGQLVRFGDGPNIIPILRDGGLEVVTRPQPPGIAPAYVTDSFDHEAASPEEFEFKAAPTFDAQPFSPAVAGTGGDVPVFVRGTGFEETDELRFDDEVVEFEVIAAAILRFTPPARDDGEYELRIQDRFGLVAVAPALRLKAPGVIDAVSPVGGAFLGTSEVSIHGGTTVRVTGSRFHVLDTVAVGGLAAELESVEDTAIEFVAPASEAGLADVVVTDAIGQQSAVLDALRFVGYRDRSATRAPGRTNVDDRSATRGAVADLDRDGEVDDVVLVSHDDAPGSRSERTRVLLGSSSGALVDGTASRIPAAGSDSSDEDDLRACAVAVGDVDGADGPDILVVGTHPGGGTYGELRLLVNDGYGDFTTDESAVPEGRYLSPVSAQDETGTVHEVYSARLVRGRPTALAIGDLDDDGDLDVVVGRDSFDARHFGVDAEDVDFGATPAYITSADAAANALDVTRYYSAVRVLRNDIDTDGELVDVTGAAMPSVGDDGVATPLPAFHARDVALADLDGDDDLDLVVTWDDPTTVTAYGLVQGANTDSPRVATRVLLNDGDGGFTDATGDWMPSGSAPEFFQASRLAIADLDGDGDGDLVLVHEEGVDVYQGPPGYSRLALRVLRNDHDPDTGEGGFSNVSSSVLPGVSGTSNDNYRGGGLLVADVDGDGALDIVVATDTAPTEDASSVTTSAIRLLSGTPGALAFRDNTEFLPPLDVDTGEADELLLIPDLSPEARPALLLLSETEPGESSGSRFLRAFDWQR